MAGRRKKDKSIIGFFNFAIDKMLSVVVPKQKRFTSTDTKKRRTRTDVDKPIRTPKTPELKVTRKRKAKNKVKPSKKTKQPQLTTPYTSVGSAVINTTTGEVVEDVSQNIVPPQEPTQHESVGKYSDIVLKNIRNKIDSEWNVFYYKPNTLNIPNANYFSGYLEGLIQAYSEDVIAEALSNINSEAIQLASQIIYASKQSELQERVESFINLVYEQLGQEFDAEESQYLQNMAEVNWFN